ncbi:type II secretion system protein N [Neptunicella marina]|uniref:Type II secretion system protein N n=1 Tax=Neptunicella marina TaxID=2125989 RepID=A0A8J6IUI2_9ALTE|nr:type II secretion system protein N [Neptunicella marina]MBC3765873.1 type II secretion system protein N [Neptunicella marina]
MKRVVLTSLLCLLVYCVFLVAHFPARQALGLVDLPANLQINGVSGTLWQGNIQQVAYQGIPLDDINWTLDTLPLLWGTASLNLTAGNIRDADIISLKSALSLSSDRIQAENLQLYVPVNMVLGQLPIPLPVNADGRFKVQIAELDYQQGCQTLSGSGQWLNAKVAGTQGPIDMGTFSARLACQQKNIRITVDPNNRLAFDANAFITPNGQFSINGKFKPDASLPAEVHQAAALFGRANSDGYYSINW